MGLFDGRGDGNRFFSMLIDQAALAVHAVRTLEGVLERVDEEAVEKLRSLARASSELRNVLIDELHKTFITPLDREDIFNLSHGYDDLIKYALATLEEMHLFGIAADEPIRRMVAMVREETEELDAAVQRLAKNPRIAGDHANAVHAKEAEVERVYRHAIHELFALASDSRNVPAILYRREVYRHLSNMSDRADAAANVFGMIVMKLA
jgi:uncharacterized protein Yka (UPF0111/DUF47 family)